MATEEGNVGENTQADSQDNTEASTDGNAQQEDSLLDGKETQNDDSGKEKVGEGDSLLDGKEEGDKETKKGDDKAEDAPKDYEAFKVPEGVSLSKDMLSEFSSMAKDAKLSQEDAQKFINLASKSNMSVVQNQDKVFKDLVAGWKSEIQDDKDFGGSKYKDTLTGANRVLNKYGTRSLIKVLSSSGIGNNPELIKMFARLDRAMSEDNVVDGKGGSSETKDISDHEIMYGED